MKKPAMALCLAAMAAAGVAFPAPVSEIVINFAARAATEPVLDGRLDDPAWKDAPVHTRFYVYLKPKPALSPVRSEMRLLYDDKALWIGLTHFEDRVDKLRAVATVRDTVSWDEDMDEIYIDPFGTAVGFTKLHVNSIGTIGDLRRVDSAVLLGEWNGDGWAAKTSVGKDRWCVEVRVPYSDLQQPPVPGGPLWRFCVTRYQFTSGRFVGTVSSPGGGFSNPGGFGYLYFLKPGVKPDVEVMTAALRGKVAPPWCVSLGERMLADLGDGPQVRDERIEDFLARQEKADRDRAESFRLKLEREFGR